MSEQSSTLYEEIDLRPYIEVLVRNWYWIVGAALVSGILVYLVISIFPPTYEASALVAVTEPRFNIQFDPRLEATESGQLNAQAYPDLAMSDVVLEELYASLSIWPEQIESAERLRTNLIAEADAGNSLLRLTVTLSDPVLASEVANQWAQVFIDRANQIYGVQGGTPLTFLETQLALAEEDLSIAEEALVEFQSSNQSVILRNQLQAYSRAQLSLLEEQQSISNAIRNATVLQSQLADLPGDQSAPVSSQLTALLLQSKAYGLSESFLELQLSGEDQIFTLTNEEQLLLLDDLIRALRFKIEEIESETSALEPEILSAQKRLQESELAANRLENRRVLAQDTYTTLARTVEEARIAAEDDNAQIQLASASAVPLEPSGSGRLLFAVMAAIGMGLLTAILVLARYIWRMT